MSARTIGRDIAAAGKEEQLRVRGRDGKTYPASRDARCTNAVFVHSLREQGMKQSEIAARLGISQPTVSRILRQWRRVA